MAVWQKALLEATHEHPLSAVHQNLDCGEEHCDRCQAYVRGAVNTAKLTLMEFQIGVHRGSA